MPAASLQPSEVKILNTNDSAKKGQGVAARETETVWPKTEFGPSTTIAHVTDAKGADGFILPAGSMFPLGCAIPQTTLQHGAYFPPGTMFPQGVLVPIHARMVSVQPLETKKPPKPSPEPACIVQ